MFGFNHCNRKRGEHGRTQEIDSSFANQLVHQLQVPWATERLSEDGIHIVTVQLALPLDLCHPPQGTYGPLKVQSTNTSQWNAAYKAMRRSAAQPATSQREIVSNVDAKSWKQPLTLIGSSEICTSNSNCPITFPSFLRQSYQTSSLGFNRSLPSTLRLEMYREIRTANNGIFFSVFHFTVSCYVLNVLGLPTSKLHTLAARITQAQQIRDLESVR